MMFTKTLLHYATPAGEFTITRCFWTRALTIETSRPDRAPSRFRASKPEVFDLARELVRIDAEEGRIPWWIADHITAILTDTEHRH